MKIFSILFLCLSFSFISYSSSELLEVEKRIISIYEKNVPSVVNVSNIKVAKSFWYGDQVEIPQGTGTGFIWDSKGHIVTNYHVIQGGDNFTISFHGIKKEFSAKVIGVDPNNDIAVLKLKSLPKNLQVSSIGKSESLKVGQLALALGNPLGFQHSFSKGIISALGRKMDGIGGVKILNMIQTDAAINQGNSGGPLLDSSGKVIGMNTMIATPSGSNAGLGFAVPVDTISRVVPQIIEHGKVIRPGLGIGVLEDHLRARYVGKKGVALTFVDPKGAAAEAGLKGMVRDRFGRTYLGDVILKVDGKEVNSKNDIFHSLDKYEIGDSVEIEYLREGEKNKIKLRLKEL